MGIGIPPKLLRKEIFMTIGDIETAVPYTNANPEEEMRKTLYSKFKETNWWARHPRVWQWASAAYWLMVIVLAVNMKNGLFLPGVVAASALGFMPFLVLLAIIRYFVHDRPRKKFNEEWSISRENWSTNVGGILKIYD